MRVTRLCAAVVVALVVVTGCARTAAEPLYACSDAAGGHVLCPKASKDAQLEAEATAVYRRFWAEGMRLLKAGGAPEATDELRATATGRALESVETHMAAHYRDQMITVALRESLTIRVSQESVPESVVALIGCEDTTGSLFRNPQGETVGTGGKREKTRFFKRVDGQLKIFDVKERETCES